jgi:hypothetical protein
MDSTSGGFAVNSATDLTMYSGAYVTSGAVVPALVVRPHFHPRRERDHICSRMGSLRGKIWKSHTALYGDKHPKHTLNNSSRLEYSEMCNGMSLLAQPISPEVFSKRTHAASPSGK